MNFYNQNIQTVLQNLNTSQSEGLSLDQVEKRKQQYGKNEFTFTKNESLIQNILSAVKEPMMIILIMAAVISGIIGEYYDAIGIICAVALGITIGIVTEGKSKKAAQALAKMTEDIKVKVLRNGVINKISKSELVPGDLIYLETGNMIPADGRFIETIDLKVREDILTGESDDVTKNANVIVELKTIKQNNKEIIQEPIPAEQINMGFTGTLVVYGKGVMVVTNIGDKTEMGKIAKNLEKGDESTPLQIKLGKLGERISKISSVVAVLLFLFMLNRMIINKSIHIDNSGIIPFLNSIEPIKTAFIVCIALIVAAVPEGLPTMVNITLAITMKKMAKIHALVTKKEACETIGSISIICSDKTGTLTQNKMTVEKLYLNGEYINRVVEDRLFIQNCLVNSTADIIMKDNQCDYLGSSTECALLLYLKDFNYKEYRKNANVLHQIPFDSKNKFMATIVNDERNKKILYVKGAPELILNHCSFENINGKIIKLTKERIENIKNNIKQLQGKSMRILAFAYRKESIGELEVAITSLSGDNCLESLGETLIFNGFAAIKDPLRPDAKEAILSAKRAGIETKMLTGDNINTAVAIGYDLGLLNNKRAVEASYIDNLDDECLKREIKDIAIVARSKPDTKMRIVQALQSNGEVVGVTGDGVNDAPALTKADVGITMGISGSEVSKNAADIILTDDKFSTIVHGIKWGRGVYENFQRFIQFQITVNIVAFLLAIISQLMGYEMPFTTIQLLWVNIIMDGPPALSLGLEPVRDEVFNTKPINRNSSIITKQMLKSIILNAIYIFIIIMIQMKFNILGASTNKIGNASEMETVLFGIFSFSALFNAFNCREFGLNSIIPNFKNNTIAIKIITSMIIIQIVITEIFKNFFNVVSLSAIMWIKIILISMSIIIVNEFIKLILRSLKSN